MLLAPAELFFEIVEVRLYRNQVPSGNQAVMKPLPAVAGHADDATSTEQLPKQAPRIDVAIEVEKPTALGHGQWFELDGLRFQLRT